MDHVSGRIVKINNRKSIEKNYKNATLTLENDVILDIIDKIRIYKYKSYNYLFFFHMRRFFIAFLLIVLIPTETFASVIFQSLFPNPLGDDTLGEYIEIRNTGCSSIDISHYSLSDASGKTYTLPNSTIIDASNSRKFPYSETKIALNNTGNE